MLVRFSVENFLSFRERVELSMIAGRTKRHPKHVTQQPHPRGFSLLKVAILYGANASGKSNLVKAIGAARQLVLEPADAGKHLPLIPFKLDKKTATEPSRFEFEIQIGTKYFAYGFVASAERIHEEWLYEFDREQERPIFERAGSKFDLGGFQISDQEKYQFLQFTAKGTPANRLFLAECKQRNVNANVPEAQVVFDVLDWFDDTLSVVFPDWRYASLEFRVLEDEQFKNELARYLCCFDTGIEGIDLQEEDFESVPISQEDRKRITEELREGEYALIAGPGRSHWVIGRTSDHDIDARRLIARHAGKNGATVGLGMDEESDGTHRLMHLAPALMLSVTSNRVFVIDELNRSLHPDISHSYLQNFLRYSEDRQSQLIVTTHETTLLSLRFLRPDEIWFVEKGTDQSSRLFSLTNSKEASSGRTCCAITFMDVSAQFPSCKISRGWGTGMPRERREFNRRSDFRDASLIIIACEGAVTEPKYFNGLKVKIHAAKVHVELLIRDQPGQSSPIAVLSMLDQFSKEYRVREMDRLWLVIDRDKWTEKMLAEVARATEQRGYLLAASNPCFEIWLLLHFEDVAGSTAQRQNELLENDEQLLKTEISSRMQPNVDYIDHFLPHTQTAIKRARALDTHPRARWPNGLGTRVYRLVESLPPTK